VHRARLSFLVLTLAMTLAACGGTAPSEPGSSASAAPPATTAGPSATLAPSSEAPSAAPTPFGEAADPQALIDAALATVDDGTVRLLYEVGFLDSTLIPDGPFLSGRGQASFGEPRQARLSAEFSGVEFGDWEMIIDDRLLYMRGRVVAQVVPDDTWLLVDLDSDHRSVPDFAEIASGQNDSSLALLYLLGATGDVRVADGGTIGGAPTDQYRLSIDLDAARDRVGVQFAEALGANIDALATSGIDRTLQADVWLGDGRVVRARYEFVLGRGQGGGRMISSYDFSDFGTPLELDIPTGDDVIRLEDAIER